MELSITSEKENKLMDRKEIMANATYDNKTPTREEIKESVSKKLGLNPELVDIVRIDQIYGLRSSTVTAYCYTDKEAMAKHERRKGKKAAAAPGDAAPAAEAKPAAKEEKAPKKEEKKEEKKA